MVLLFSCGLVVQLDGELALTHKLIVCLIMVPCEHFQHSINVSLIFTRWLVGLVLRFLIRIVIVLVGEFAVRSMTLR